MLPSDYEADYAELSAEAISVGVNAAGTITYAGYLWQYGRSGYTSTGVLVAYSSVGTQLDNVTLGGTTPLDIAVAANGDVFVASQRFFPFYFGISLAAVQVAVYPSYKPAPVVASIQPAFVSTAGGTLVTLSGAHFGDSAQGSSLFVNHVRVLPVSWNDTSIVFATPAAATSTLAASSTQLPIALSVACKSPSSYPALMFVPAVAQASSLLPAGCTATLANGSVVVAMTLAASTVPTVHSVIHKLAPLFHLAANVMHACVTPLATPAAGTATTTTTALHTSVVTVVLPPSVLSNSTLSQYAALSTAVTAAPAAVLPSAVQASPTTVSVFVLPYVPPMYWSVLYTYAPTATDSLQLVVNVTGCVVTSGTAIQAAYGAGDALRAAYPILSGHGAIIATTHLGTTSTTAATVNVTAVWTVPATVAGAHQPLFVQVPHLLSSGLAITIANITVTAAPNQPALAVSFVQQQVGQIVLADPTTPSTSNLLHFAPTTTAAC